MTKRQEIVQFQNALAAFVDDATSKGHFTSRELAIEFRKRHHSAVNDLSDYLIELALVPKIIRELKRRSNDNFSMDQMSLFAEFKIDPNVTVPVTTGNRNRVWKPVVSLTLREVRRWVSDHTKAPPRRNKSTTELERLLLTVEPYMDDGMTLGEAYNAWRRATS